MESNTAEGLADLLAGRLCLRQFELVNDWVVRRGGADPSDHAREPLEAPELLPRIVEEVCSCLRQPSDMEHADPPFEHTRAFARQHHDRHGSLEQLLVECASLAETLERFAAREMTETGLRPSPEECFDLARRLSRATRALTRAAATAFLARYTEIVEDQTQQLRRFTRIASHELRNPIGTILVGANLLQREQIQADAARVSKIAGTVRANAERLGELLRNLQRVTRLDGAPDLPALQPADVRAIATDIAGQLREMAQARGVTIAIAEDLPTLAVLPAQLELALLNLMSNAIKYADPEKPHRYVEVADGGGGGAIHTIVVRDNGIGIPPEAHAAIFERFVRAHSARDEELGSDGMGLGLTIAAECVQALGGALRFESTVGVGTTFFLELPAGGIDDRRAQSEGV